MIKVVHPAYHWLPNGGQGSFFESGNRLLSCVRVFATAGEDGLVEHGRHRDCGIATAHSAGYVMATRWHQQLISKWT